MNISDPKNVADGFGGFFATIGKDIQDKIPRSNTANINCLKEREAMSIFFLLQPHQLRH